MCLDQRCRFWVVSNDGWMDAGGEWCWLMFFYEDGCTATHGFRVGKVSDELLIKRVFHRNTGAS